VIAYGTDIRRAFGHTGTVPAPSSHGLTAHDQTVVDPDDPRLNDYRCLRPVGGTRRRERDEPTVIIEGHLALSRAVQGSLRLRSVIMTPQRARSLTGLRADIPAAVPLYVAERQVLTEVTGFDVHRGVLASAERPTATDPAGLLSRHRRTVLLEGLTDLENVGATFRVAAALDIGAVLLDDSCADPLYRRCVRVSLGWSTVVPHARFSSTAAGLAAGRALGVRSVALIPAPNAVPVDRAAIEGMLDDPLILLVGSEGSGLAPSTIDAADHRVSIPMADGVDSLNAATALAVVASFAAAARGWN
jgi:tRNA G18 (ribose-2'-O)-methylase SpoU